MSGPLQIFFDDRFYEASVLAGIVDTFSGVLDIDLERIEGGTLVTVPEDEQAERIAGEFSNMALARSMEMHR